MQTLLKVLCVGFACLLSGASGIDSTITADKHSWISLNSVSFDTETHTPEFPPHLLSKEISQGESGYYIVKFNGPITKQNYESLITSVTRIYTYLPNYAYLVKMQRSSGDSILGSTGASWVGRFHPAYKLSRWISEVKESQSEVLNIVMVQVFPDARLDDVLTRLNELGVKRIAASGGQGLFSRIKLLLTQTEIAHLRDEIAQIDDVFWIDMEARIVLHNDTTTWVGQSGLSNNEATPIFENGIYGEGQIVASLDTGIDIDMCYFYDESQGLPPTNECDMGEVVDLNQRKVIAVDFIYDGECTGGISSDEWDTHNHGTHVGGTIAGDDFEDLLIHNMGDGMAPGAKLVIQDGGYAADD